MTTADTSQFQTTLFRPVTLDGKARWSFVVLPRAVSEKLPRRGRTTVEGTINGCPFQATLEPDGKLSHWLKVSEELRDAAKANIGDMVQVEITPVNAEPEPQLPDDLLAAITASTQALAVWQETTTIARLDWIHWIESAKQAKTREIRVGKACDMLASGKKRVLL